MCPDQGFQGHICVQTRHSKVKSVCRLGIPRSHTCPDQVFQGHICVQTRDSKVTSVCRLGIPRSHTCPDSAFHGHTHVQTMHIHRWAHHPVTPSTHVVRERHFPFLLLLRSNQTRYCHPRGYHGNDPVLTPVPTRRVSTAIVCHHANCGVPPQKKPAYESTEHIANQAIMLNKHLCPFIKLTA